MALDAALADFRDAGASSYRVALAIEAYVDARLTEHVRAQHDNVGPWRIRKTAGEEARGVERTEDDPSQGKLHEAVARALAGYGTGEDWSGESAVAICAVRAYDRQRAAEIGKWLWHRGVYAPNCRIDDLGNLILDAIEQATPMSDTAAVSGEKE